MKNYINYNLSNEISFKINCFAENFIETNSINEFIFLLKNFKNKKHCVIGAGTNILFANNFYDGIVFSTKGLKEVKQIGSNEVEVMCGTNCYVLNYFLWKHGLQGFEWSFGIPGSIGGMLKMNAGAFGFEISSFVKTIQVFDGKKVFDITKNDINFGYRSSGLNDLVVLKCRLCFEKGEKEKIKQKQIDYFLKRKESQPVDKFSAGSVFKREKQTIPAKLIDKLGLKGVKIGGAEISKKHSGFIINSNNASARDVIKLMELIEKKVFDEFGVVLEREIEIKE